MEDNLKQSKKVAVKALKIKNDFKCASLHEHHSTFCETIKNICPFDDENHDILGETPDENQFRRLSELYKTLGDITRIRIIWMLQNRELPVYELAALLNMEQSAVSHQLRILRGADLVRSRRDGKSIFYTLDDDHVNQLFSISLIHIKEKKL